MKLHIKKDWIKKFDHQAKEIEYGAGVDLGIDSNLSALNATLCDIDWNKFPIKKMVKYGWIKGKTKELLSGPKDFLSDFFSPFGNKLPEEILCRRTIHANSNRSLDRYALLAWCARVLTKAMQTGTKTGYKSTSMNDQFLYDLSRLSKHKDGPLQAQKKLKSIGIILVVERHLPGTYLDGAAMLADNKVPVIGLTLRFDRIDNFWFTLIHEVVHVWKHLTNEMEWFVDDFEKEINCSKSERLEREANKYTRNIFIPKSKWRRSEAYSLRDSKSVYALSEELDIHPAIIAGRIQREFNRYDLLREIVDPFKVRKFFDDVTWN